MRNLLFADGYRMFRQKWFWLCALLMAVVSVALLSIQHGALAYTVSIDRVIFLPMSFYGIAAAALVSLFVGADFSDGVVKNKVISGASRRAIYFSGLLVAWAGCVCLYLVMLAMTLTLGTQWFPVNVSAGAVLRCGLLGLLTCLAYGSIYLMVSMLAGNKAVAAILCMALSFAMLFLCLHTNQVLTQKAYLDGVRNPAYVDGAKRLVYAFLHDGNPTGQAAQLSAMHCFDEVRFVAADLFWIAAAGLAGAWVFNRKDIR